MKSYLKYKNLYASLVLLVILLFAFFLRLYGINWDQNQHLHPDERFLTMVTQAVSWPKSLSEYLDTNLSPLNPHNNNFGFYVYGTFPLFFVKAVAEFIGKADYNSLTLTGRLISATLDTLTAFLVFLITFKITKRWITSIFSLFIYTFSVLPIQLSHYFTVDPFLVFFSTLTFLLILHLKEHEKITSILLTSVLAGMSFGLAFASKIQVLLFLPTLLIGIILLPKKRDLLGILLSLSVFITSAFFSIRLAQPYLFAEDSLLSLKLNTKTLDNWKELNNQYSEKTYRDNISIYFPPATIFINAKDYLFPLENIILWGSGIPLGLTYIIALIFLSFKSLKHIQKSSNWPILLIIFWISYFFLYQGQVFAKYLRYFYIIYPFLSIVAALFLTELKGNKTGKFVTLLILLPTVIWALSFMSIYSRGHSRIKASEWIYRNIPAKSYLTHEHWDDMLPLCIKSHPCGNYYNHIELPLYDTDTEEKWIKIKEKLDKAEYIILSSNRLYGSIMTVPDRYPKTSKYFESRWVL